MDPNAQRLIMGAAGANSNRIYATDVFNSTAYSVVSTLQTITTGINLADYSGLEIFKRRNSPAVSSYFVDVCWGSKYVRLPTATPYYTSYPLDIWTTTGIEIGYNDPGYNESGGTYVLHTFRNAAKFFQAYNGSVNVNSNVPLSFAQLGTIGAVIVQGGYNNSPFYFWHRSLSSGKLLSWNNNQAQYNAGSISVSGTDVTLNASDYGGGIVSVYAFAHDAGGFGASGNDSIIRCGNYTGTGTTQSINCGFTTGARFVMIKRTDSTGDWYVWDTARGIVSGNDPYWLINSTAAEVTGTDYIDPLSSGFQISSTAPAAINANGGSFIYLAVA
jgi:hypothetical protein